MLSANYSLDDSVLAEVSWKSPRERTDRTFAVDVDIYLSCPKEGKKYPQQLRSWDIVWDKMFCHFFPFWMNKNVSFSFGLTLTCTCRLPWSCTSSLLSSVAHSPGVADLDFPQIGMSALQCRPEAAGAPVDEASCFWGPWHQLFRLLDIPSLMLLFDLSGSH